MLAFLILAAEAAAGAVAVPSAVPIYIATAVGAALVAALGYMTRSYQAAVTNAIAQNAALVREAVAAITANTEVQRQHTELLKEQGEMIRSLADMIKELKRG